MNNKQKLFVGVLVALLLTTGVISFVGTDTLFCLTVTYDGNGTEANPYEVSNVEQLQCINEQSLSANYVQVSNIEASKTSGFTPIGESGSGFTGRFDGQGYNITNLTIDGGRWYIGLFGWVHYGEVRNVTLMDVDITGGNGVESMVGSNMGTVSNSHATGSVEGSGYVGGLVGINRQRSTVENSSASVSVDGGGSVGSLVGRNTGRVTESYATGSVEGDEVVGGLIGRNTWEISESYANGSVEGNEIVGGLVGNNEGVVNKSYANGSVDGDKNVGGLVGYGDEGAVTKSYAMGSVRGYRRVGGIIGHNKKGTTSESTISESYATGSVEGRAISEGSTGSVGGRGKVSGLAGKNTGTVRSSYWDREATGQSISTGGTGLNTSEMTGSAARENLTGFDFNNTWVSRPEDYPVLAWQAERDSRD
jgi:hypothetical protein